MFLEDFESRERNLKVIIVGDGGVGKTSLLHSYVNNEKPPTDYIPTVFDNHNVNCMYKNNVYNLSLWDTAGQEGYDELRVLSYPDTDVFILTFSLNSRVSFENIEDKWYPEIKKYWNKTPMILLVGSKSDLKSEVEDELVFKLKEKMKAIHYLKCSARNMEGILPIFDSILKYDFEKSKGSNNTTVGNKKKRNSKTIGNLFGLFDSSQIIHE